MFGIKKKMNLMSMMNVKKIMNLCKQLISRQQDDILSGKWKPFFQNRPTQQYASITNMAIVNFVSSASIIISMKFALRIRVMQLTVIEDIQKNANIIENVEAVNLVPSVAIFIHALAITMRFSKKCKYLVNAEKTFSSKSTTCLQRLRRKCAR